MEAAAERKARLKAMRAAALGEAAPAVADDAAALGEGEEGGDGDGAPAAKRQKLAGGDGEGREEEGEAEAEAGPKEIKFRNYQPATGELKEKVLEPSSIPNLNSQVQDVMALAKESRGVVEEVDLVNLMPRKVDYDLKRDLAKKLDKLERRTQRAIAQIVHERLSRENAAGQSGADLAGAVGMQKAANDSDSD